VDAVEIGLLAEKPRRPSVTSNPTRWRFAKATTGTAVIDFFAQVGYVGTSPGVEPDVRISPAIAESREGW